MNSNKRTSARSSPEKSSPEKENTNERKKQHADDSVDEASRESFPASDAPAWPIPERRKEH